MKHKHIVRAFAVAVCSLVIATSSGCVGTVFDEDEDVAFRGTGTDGDTDTEGADEPASVDPNRAAPPGPANDEDEDEDDGAQPLDEAGDKPNADLDKHEDPDEDSVDPQDLQDRSD